MAIMTLSGSQLLFSTLSDTDEMELLSCSSCYENHKESGIECRYYRQMPCTSVQYVDCCGLRTPFLQLSPGFSRTIIFLLVLSSCWTPCSCGLNCTNYNVSCSHGTCVQVKPTVRDVNRTGSVACVCEDLWSGSACDVFSCSGRTL